MTQFQLHNLGPLIEASDIWAQNPNAVLWLAFEPDTGRIRLTRSDPGDQVHFADLRLLPTFNIEPNPSPRTTVYVEWPAGRHKLVTPNSWTPDAPYIGRPYQLGTFDCYTLVRDWMRRERGIDMDYLTESADRLVNEWLTDGAFETNSELHKWDRVVNPQPGDGILFAMTTNGPARANHAGVYLGNGQFLHHFPNRASTVSPLDEQWRARVAAYMRHNG